MTKKLKINLLLILALGITWSIPQTFAAVEHLNLPLCNLAVYPFTPNSAPLFGQQAAPLINYLGENVCKSRTVYGSAYNQPPKEAENPLKSGAEGKHIPKVDHLHAYVNTSLQDNYYYRSFVDKFEIKLQTDSLQNADLNSVQCVTPVPGSYQGNLNDLLDCNGTAPDLYGGTKISYNKSTGVILWEFGTSNSSQRPQRWGNNSGLNSIISAITGNQVNLSNSNDLYRKFDPEITFLSKDNNETIWSATTTSKVLIRNYAILKTSVNNSAPNYGNFNEYCSVASDFTKWCPLPTPAGNNYVVEKLGDNNQQEFFWFPIGSVVSVWQKPAVEKPICVGLTVSPNQLGPNTPVTFTVTPKFSPAGQSLPLNYNWNAVSAPLFIPGLFIDLIQTPETGADLNWVNLNLGNVLNNNASQVTFCMLNPDLCEGQQQFKPAPLPIQQFGQTSVLTAPQLLAALPKPGITSTSLLQGTATLKLPDMFKNLVYGGFKDSQSSNTIPTNPFLETIDSKTWYSGGPGGTLLTVQGQAKDGTVFPLCKGTILIPLPKSLCQLLKVNFIDQATNQKTENLEAGKTYLIQVDQLVSKKTDGSPITKYKIQVGNSGGSHGTLVPSPNNAATCSTVSSGAGHSFTDEPTAVSCSYLYTPKAGDKISLFAEPHDNVAACRIEKTVPAAPEKFCRALVPTINGVDFTSNDQLNSGASSFDFGINVGSSQFTDGTTLDNYSLTIIGNGDLIAKTPSYNGQTCPAQEPKFPNTPSNFIIQVRDAPLGCVYTYTGAKPGDYVTFSTPPKIVEPDLGQCYKSFQIPPTTTTEVCLNINLSVNGQLNNSPAVNPNNNYNLQVNPITNQGNKIQMVTWTENGAGQLVGNPLNDLLYPGICPAIINDQSVTIPSFCKYFYSTAANQNQSGGFSVDAVITGNLQDSPACHAASSFFTPPVNQPDRCLYLDLDYQPEPFSNVDANGATHPTSMTARVALLSGQQYTGQVRFRTNDGSGNFSGGINGSGTNPRDTGVDSFNNTQVVNYQPGNPTTGLDVFLINAPADLDISSPACQVALRPVVIPKEKYKCEVPPRIEQKSGNQYCADHVEIGQTLCWNINGATFNGGRTKDSGNCVTLDNNPQNFNLNVEDCNPAFRNFCYDNYRKVNVPSVEKRISKSPTANFGNSITYPTTGKENPEAFYQIIFTPANYQDDTFMQAEIHDPAFKGEISGSIPGGKIDFSNIGNTIKVSQSGTNYNQCSAGTKPDVKCYFLNQGQGFLQLQGITSTDPITIKYSGTVKSAITNADCQSGKYCNERFENISSSEKMKFCTSTTDDEGNVIWTCTDDQNYPKIESNKTTAELVCQYFLTRASGDVFLENKLEYGVDISKCYPFKNTGGPIITPIDTIQQNLAKTGSPEIVNIGHEICSAGQTDFSKLNLKQEQIDQLKEIYGSDISSLSSQICEIGLIPGTSWTKEDIKNAILSNIDKLTLWATSSTTNVVDFTNNPVFYFEGSSNNNLVTLNAMEIAEGSGAKTIIVRNADLYISGNITYGSGTAEKSTDIASLGVIVINGNLIIDPTVTNLAGAYLVVSSDSLDFTKGRVLSGKTAAGGELSEVQLTVTGSLFGDIGDLFKNRVASGAVAEDQGAVTVRYDQRIIDNPPVGLSEIFGSLSQSQIAQ